MITDRWQKSSYCQEGDACVRISADSDKIHTGSDAARTVVTVSRDAFTALLKSL
ncbi:DUF397 domain-containing protein [Streptomyces canus]|uniref:DUF397 domain-containing protein n=1 Tax=Streptomyces canus TaxID=58343 RepID=UPI0036745846